MMWQLKKLIGGRKFVVDMDTIWNLALEIFNWRINRAWSSECIIDRKSNELFVQKALSILPEEHYIVFLLDTGETFFVQFCKYRGHIILDFPMWKTNPAFGKKSMIVKILKFQGFSHSYSRPGKDMTTAYRFWSLNLGKDKKGIRANFGKDIKKGTQTVYLIARKIYGFNNPRVVSFHSDKLKSYEQ